MGKEPSLTGKATRIGISVISLGSRRFGEATLRELAGEVVRAGCQTLLLVLLDREECATLTRLFGITPGMAERAVRRRVEMFRCSVRSFIPCAVEFVLSSTAATRPSREQIAQIRKQVGESALLSAVFSNLRPVLTRLGVKNQRAPAVSEIADYLIYEASVRAEVVEQRRPDVEFTIGGDGAIMDSLSALLSGGGAVGHRPRRVELDVEPTSQAVEMEDVSLTLRGPGRRFSLTVKRWTVETGQVMGVIGSSGAGKTSLLRVIAGHVKINRGKIRIGGEDVRSRAPYERRVATVFQGGGLFPDLSCRENVELATARHLSGKKSRSAEADYFLQLLGVGDLGAALPATVSGGQLQRVSLARALAARPMVLLMDEPTTYLDAISRQDLVNTLNTIVVVPPSPTVIIVSHDADFLVSVCDTITVIASGQVVSQGSTKDLLAKPVSGATAALLGRHTVLTGVYCEHSHIFDAEPAGSVEIPSTADESSGTSTVVLAIPHTAIRYHSGSHGERNVLRGVVQWRRDLEHVVTLGVRLVGQPAVVQVSCPSNVKSRTSAHVGASVALAVDGSHAVVLPP